MYAVKIRNNKLYYLDQTRLPLKEVWLECKNLKQGFIAIKELKVRGAPLIGVFAAYCICVASGEFSSHKEDFLKDFDKAVKHLKTSRPTAVNLFWALECLEKTVLAYKDKPLIQIEKAIWHKAKEIYKEDVELCNKMADYGVKLIKEGDSILTHCNAGALATAGEGTALGVIHKAHRIYKGIKVYVDETRPLLQGARLTAWELVKNKVSCTLICDNMAAYLMQKGKIDKIFVGADRIAANGDVANKIGTYNVAVTANYHKVPFYVVAPFSTFDLRLKDGQSIPIEERPQDEVRTILKKLCVAPKNVPVFNPAFDVTPCELITAIVTDRGIIYPPFEENISKMIRIKKD